MAIAYAVLGDYDHALKLANEIDKNNYQEEAIGYIAYRLAKDGYEGKAEELLENLNDSNEDVKTYKALCYVRLGKIDKAKEILSSLSFINLQRILLELTEVGRFEDAVEVVENLADKLESDELESYKRRFRCYKIRHILSDTFHYSDPDPDYESKSLIFRIASSDLDESEKIDLLNRIYSIAERLSRSSRNYVLEELAEAIAWYSLRDRIVERAKRLEERGHIVKALKLYGFADEVEEFNRLRERLVGVNVEAPLDVNEKGELKISIKPVTTVYNLNVEFESDDVKLVRDGKEVGSFSIPIVTDNLSESFEIVPLKPNIVEVNVKFKYRYIDCVWGEKSSWSEKWILMSKTETRTLFLNVKEAVTTPDQLTEGEAIVPGFPPQLLSKYEPIELLGEGGFARVFKCRRKKDGTLVAVKIPEYYEEAGKSFVEEISNWGRLNHINIVQLYDYNSLPYPHIEMELCDCTLKDLKNLTLKDMLKIALSIADALSYAHSKGIVHGDLKPSNVLIKRVGDQTIPKLTDWGMGYTPAYSPPEVVIDGFKPDEQSDVWSFGVLLYELVTGINPFQGEDEIETLDRVAELKPDLSPLGILKPIVARCLEKDRSKRYRSIIEVRRDLANLSVSTLSNLFSKSKSREERLQTAIEIVATYITSNEFEKAEKRIDSMHRHRLITPQAHEAYRTIIEILKAEEIPLDILDSKYKHILEILPEYKEEFENDEYIGKLLRKIMAHCVREVIRRGDDDFDKIKNVFCMRILDKLGMISCEIL